VAISFSSCLPALGVAGKFLNLASVFYTVEILFHSLTSICLLSVVCVCALEKVFGIFILAYKGVSFLLRQFLLKYEGCFFFNLRWAIKKRQIDIT